MEDNVSWNRIGERILRTAAVRYLAMNLQRLRHPALVASAPLLDWNLPEHVRFRAGCIMSHNCVVLLRVVWMVDRFNLTLHGIANWLSIFGQLLLDVG